MMNFFQSNMQTSILVLLIVLVAILCIIIFFMRKNIGSLNDKLKIYVNEFLAFRETTSPILNLHYAKNRISSNMQDPNSTNNTEKKTVDNSSMPPSTISEVKNTSSLITESVEIPSGISQGSNSVGDDESDYIGETDDEEDSENEEEKEENDPEINEIVKQAEEV